MKGMLAEVFAHNTFAYLPGPYHFLATFETFTTDGQPDGNGSIEKFFFAPGRLKVVTRFRDHTMMAYLVDGKWKYTDDGFSGTIMTYFVNDFLLTPLPPPIGTARKDMETSVLQLQGATLDCATYQFFLEPPDMPVPPKEMLCFSRDSFDLALRQTQHLSVRFQEFSPFLGRSIPHYIVASEGAVVRCRIHMQQVDQQALDDAALTPPEDASLVSPGPNWIATSNGEGEPVHRVNPNYPPQMRDKHVGGPVNLLVLISRTGTVKDIEPLYAPTPELMQAAIDAVKQWTYAPVVRQGKPLETITEAHINFALKH